VRVEIKLNVFIADVDNSGGFFISPTIPLDY
jgi:hypothetical protein